MTTSQRYEVLGRVATTRTGAVWKARDVGLDRLVALKEIAAADREVLYREASAIAALNSEHIVEVYGIEEDGTAAYLVEEWVDGATVAAVVRANGRMPAAQGLSVIRGGLLGLAAAHRAGLVHGDVSMSNILVDSSGRARLIDFGSVSVSGTSAQPTTGAFAAPEVLAGQPATTAADVYAAAGVLAALLHGRIERSPSTRGIDGPIKDVLDRALNPARDLRHPDAAAFLAALEEAATRTYGMSWWSQAGLGAAATASIAALVPLGAAVAGAAAAATVAGAGTASGASASTAVTASATTSAATSTGAGIAAGSSAQVVSATASNATVGRALGKAAWHSRRLWIGIGATAAVAAGGTALAVTVASNNLPSKAHAGSPPSTSVSAGPSGRAGPTGPITVSATFAIKLGDHVSPGQPEPGAGHVDVGQAQDYTFAGTSGSTIYVEGVQTKCTAGVAYYELIKPDGTKSYWGTDVCNNIGRETLDASGTWTVRVSAETGGDFSFGIDGVSDSGSDTIALGDSRVGSIDRPGQRRTYFIPGLKANQVIYLAGDNSKDCVSGKVYLELRKPDGSSAYFGGGTCNNPGRFVIDVPGKWQIVAYGTNNGHETGGYRFRLYAVTDKIGDTSIGETTAGTLEAVGVHHDYRFSAQAGQVIYLEGDTSTSCTSGLVRYDLRMPDGSPAYFGSDTCGNAGRFEIKVSGTWIVRLAGQDNEHNTGPFSFHIYAVADATDAIQLGQQLTGRITEFGQYHTYKFSVQAGEAIYLQGSTSTSCQGGLVRYDLYMPDGSPAYFGSDVCSDAGRFVAKVGGTWSLRVYGQDNGHNLGSYNLLVKRG